MNPDILFKSGLPGDENCYHQQHVQLMLDSFHRCTGDVLFNSTFLGVALAEEIFNAPFVLISHGIEKDPIFNYANQTALKLFGMTWQEFTHMPSRYSAEQPNRDERARLLAEVTSKGFISNYSGIRIAKDGSRFKIDKAVVWNLTDQKGKFFGQAAYFRNWRSL